MNQRIVLSLALVVCLGSPASAGAQTIIYVDASAPLPDPPCPPGGDGMSWCTAFTDLQDALQAPPANSEIWVANGTYIPGGVQSDFFQLKALVEIYGGFEGADSVSFPGGETQRDQRNSDPTTNGTILSGDIGQDDNPDGTIVGTNTQIVAKGSPGDFLLARLDGFTIKGATSAAIENVNSSPTLANLLITGNTSGGTGAGLRNLEGSSPRVSNCAFSDNHCFAIGGAMYNAVSSSPIVTDCSFTANIADDSGGAVGTIMQSDPIFTNCTFTLNQAGFGGGGVFVDQGSFPVLRGCTFTQNSALSTFGGGLRSDLSTPRASRWMLK